MRNYQLSDYTWNYYTYCLVNLTTGRIAHESDDLEFIKALKREQAGDGCTYVIQQQHNVARIIG